MRQVKNDVFPSFQIPADKVNEVEALKNPEQGVGQSSIQISLSSNVSFNFFKKSVRSPLRPLMSQNSRE